MASLDLLDTPRRASLNTRSTSLRASIKEWERSFSAAHNGKKPSKRDIKANAAIAVKYKEFQKLGDILSGKLAVGTLPSPTKKQKPDSVRRRLYDLTPRKPKIAVAESHPSRIDPYDAPPSATPKRFLREIAPTPQRDGKVLGLFDLLSNSGGSSGSMNASGGSSKKRKVDVLIETDYIVAQTPSRKRLAAGEDILQHPGSATGKSASIERRLGRTPASESKKFMLNHFFATPSARRYTDVVGAEEAITVEKTPLRNLVLGLGSAEKLQSRAAEDLHDTTPVFLRRSHSFKERLVSAKPGHQALYPSAVRRGPSTMRHYKSAPKPLSQIVRDLQNAAAPDFPDKQNDDYNDNDDDDDDAMEAMRETETNVQVAETQTQELSDFEGQGESDLDDGKPVLEKEKVWKKKGQKRTTKRSNMKPTFVKQAKAPKFVAAEESEDEIIRVEETQLHGDIDGTVSSPYAEFPDDELQNLEESRQEQADLEDDFQPEADDGHEAPGDVPGPSKKRRKARPSTDTDEPHAFKPKKSSRAATINPNAISHQNFKSLKIRGKTAKPTGAGGRGRFGRKR